MPRVTYVKSARQRYATVKVLNEDGTPKRVPMTKRDGTQIVTKRGPKFLTLTEQDRTKPKPNLRCDFPGCTIDGGEIKPGTAYKWIKPKSGPYGGRQRSRHAAHPNWNVWEYSDSLDARLQQIAYDATSGSGDWESSDDVQNALDDLASQVEELGTEWAEKADNVEEGFGHSTYVSDELREKAEGLESWAEDIRNADIPDAPEVDDFTYDEEGEEVEDPSDLDNSDRYDSEGQSYEDALSAWQDEAVQAVESAMEQPF